MNNIYVGNLPYDVTAENLRDLFSEYGEVVKTNIVFDRETGRSRGFGFVEMPDDDAAANAISELAGQSYQGRPLTINMARPRGSGRKHAHIGGNRSAAMHTKADEEEGNSADDGNAKPSDPSPQETSDTQSGSVGYSNQRLRA